MYRGIRRDNCTRVTLIFSVFLRFYYMYGWHEQNHLQNHRTFIRASYWKYQRNGLILSAEERRKSTWSKQHRTPRAPVFCWQKRKSEHYRSSSWDMKGSVDSVSHQRSSSSLSSFSCVFHRPYCTFQLIHSHIYPYPTGQALFNCLPPGMYFSMYDKHCSLLRVCVSSKKRKL